MLVGLAFLIQWLAFIPAFLLQTERFFDLTGSLTYIAVVTLGVLLAQAVDARALLLCAMVVIWAARLGTFLFRRIRAAGKDARFDEIKPSFIRFLNVWTIQGLWVTFTVGAALAAITTTCRRPLDLVAIIGVLLWVLGFAIEVVADAQKGALQRRSGEPRAIHPIRLVEPVPASELLRRDRLVDRHRPGRRARPATLAPGYADLSCLRGVPAHSRQRHSFARKTGR